MIKIRAADYVAQAITLLNHTELEPIPYVPGGSGMDGMDCQGLAEYLLGQCGVPRSEYNLKGSNAHYRNCVWVGTPEECVAKFGRVYPGMWIFIVSNDGGEIEKGYDDELGNAEHMGVYIGNGVAIHASASRKQVAESVFKEKTIRNGGWNAVGIPPWIDYGIELNEEEFDDDSEIIHETYEEEPEIVVASPSVVRIVTPDGNPVKMRAEPSRLCNLYWKIQNGSRVLVKKRVHANGRDWVKVTYNNRVGYVMADYTMAVKS